MGEHVLHPSAVRDLKARLHGELILSNAFLEAWYPHQVLSVQHRLGPANRLWGQRH